jgi:hypothetical protein
MLKTPGTYKEWIECIDTFVEGIMDESIFEAMNKGILSWQAGVADRITEQIFKALEVRTKSINDMLQKQLKAPSVSENQIVNALINGRVAIENLLRLSTVKPFPEELKKSIADTIISYADSIQSSLIDSARNDRTGKLSVIVKNNPINRLNRDKNIEAKDEASNLIGLGKAVNKRRIIIS